MVTVRRRHDALVFEQICKKIPQGIGHVMLDFAYLSHNICTLIKKETHSNNSAKKKCACAWI